jgi:hypothetical protein
LLQKQIGKKLPGKWAEGCTRGVEGTNGEERALFERTPGEGAKGAEENTGAARAGEGRVHTQWATSGTEEMWMCPEGVKVGEGVVIGWGV